MTERGKPLQHTQAERVVIGRIAGLYGVRGWLRIYSYTDPRENVVAYKTWLIGGNDRWSEVQVEAGRPQGKGVVAKLVNCDNRDAAGPFLGKEIAIYRDEMGEAGPGAFFWVDLEGARVKTIKGVDLGIVDHLFATGANDVIVVRGERERLIPFVQGDVIRNVDLEQGLIEVDWDPDF